MKKIMKFLTLLIFFTACSSPKKEDRSISSEWTKESDPEHLFIRENATVQGFETKYNSLKKSGIISQDPWTGDYWASHRAGIAYRWRVNQGGHQKGEVDPEAFKYLDRIGEPPNGDINYLSPAEKWDLYIGDTNFTLTKSEFKRTGIGRRDIPAWEGLCHSWAPATVHYKNPKPVTVETSGGERLTFYSSDIKALLTYFLHWDTNEDRRSFTNFVGGRCNDSERGHAIVDTLSFIPVIGGRIDRFYNRNICTETNAGAFHIALANVVGKDGKSFIFDITKTAEVWNQGIQSYQTKELKRSTQVYRGAAPDTREIVTVETKIRYVAEPVHPFSEDGINNLRGEDISSVEKATSPVIFRYTLELNGQGEIIGGEWLKGSFLTNLRGAWSGTAVQNKPDFLWKQTVPAFYGRFKKLELLYKQSIGESLPWTTADFRDQGFIQILAKDRVKERLFRFGGKVFSKKAKYVKGFRQTYFLGRDIGITKKVPITNEGLFVIKLSLPSNWLQYKNTYRLTLKTFSEDGTNLDTVSFLKEDLEQMSL